MARAAADDRSADRGRRVLVTGVGMVSPLGNTPQELWSALSEGRSGVVAAPVYAAAGLPMGVAGLATGFVGAIEDFGPQEGARKKAIRKALKLMCRETKMAVAAAQKAIASASLSTAQSATKAVNPERCGVVLGSDYMLSMPEDYAAAMRGCVSEGSFDFALWGERGLQAMQPLWMLLYLPNMPASHIAILSDLRGPNNSLTMREASGLLAIGEAGRIIARGAADVMLAGATGTRVLPMQAVHAMQDGPLATPRPAEGGDPATASRPFDRDRTGMVAGEGAGVIVLEAADSAERRGVHAYGELLGFGAACVADRSAAGRTEAALAGAMRAALNDAGLPPESIDHVNAHGLGTPRSDAAEARAIAGVFGPIGSAPPVFAPKASFGNLGAGGGVVELIASLLALDQACLPRTINHETPDPDCPVRVAAGPGVPAGDRFVATNTTPQGQAAAVAVGRCPGGRASPRVPGSSSPGR